MLVRKIDISNWKNNDVVIKPVSADAITNCLKTKRNTLSVWRINNENELEEAVLAIVSGPNQKYLESIDVVILNEEYFNNEITTKMTEGDTVVEDLKNTHIDLCSLNILTIGKIAEYIVESIEKNNHKRFTKTKLNEILKKAVDKKRLNLTDLAKDMQNKIK